MKAQLCIGAGDPLGLFHNILPMKKIIAFSAMLLLMIGLLVPAGAITSSAQTMPGISVSSPNGGENIATGSVYPIHWQVTSANSYDTYRTVIRLTNNDNAKSREISSDMTSRAGDNIFYWSVPGGLDAGGHYRIDIGIAGFNGEVSDESDGEFYLYKGTANHSFSLVANPGSGTAPLKVNLVGTISNMTCGAAYTWDFGDGATATTTENCSGTDLPFSYRQVVQSHTYAEAGEYSAHVSAKWQSQTLESNKVIITVSATGNTNGNSNNSNTNGTINHPPVISGISGPTVLAAGETGTFTVRASDPNNGSLSYSVRWGDEGTIHAQGMRSSDAYTQTATMTHAYSQAGVYTPLFTVKNQQGLTATASLSVKVGRGTNENENDNGNSNENGSTVSIMNFSFMPSSMTVRAGTTVTWTNHDSMNHTVTSDSGLFNSGLLAKDQSYRYTFQNAGTYTYHCTPHPNMKGTIIVIGSNSGNENENENENYNENGNIARPPAGFEDEVVVNSNSFPNPFNDTDISTLQGQAAAELYRRAVIGGFPDGEFKGERPVNRAEGAKFLLLTRYGAVGDMANDGHFPDVLDGEWYTSFVMNASILGIIQGYPDGMFRPQNTINTAEFLKMMSLTFGLSQNLKYSYTDVPRGIWYARYAGIAQKYNLFPDRGTNQLSPARNLTRYEVAVAIYQYLLNR